MNVSVRTNSCDPARLELFLSGELTGAQERELMSHLNTCDDCRRSLQQQAAEPESWLEAERLLRPAEFDRCGMDAADAADVGWDAGSIRHEEPTPQSLQIRSVLDGLGPTDDPAMLGRLGGYEVSGVVGAGGMGVVLK